MDIAAWLESLGLGEYAPVFAENRIGADVLPQLTEQDLRDLGIVALGDRKRLMAAIADAAAPPMPAAGDGERRQVTVLFADIAGFTALSERLGAEAVHEVLNRFFDAADRLVEEFGGSVDKHIGDNVMAVFGAPFAHDNDPERAVRAALAIHQAARAIETPEGPLALHIGIASGQVVASGTGSEAHREYTVTGDSVNLAARLQGLAENGQTLVSEAVQHQVAGLFETTALGAQMLKGIARPVSVYRIDGPAQTGAARRTTPFVGRRSELGQCQAILDQVAATGAGQTVLLRGPAGIGKTRLTEEVARAAREAGFAVHRSLVLDFGTRKGQRAIPAMVRSLLALPPSSSKADRARAADAALAAGAFAEAQRVFVNDLLDLPQPLELRALYDAMDEAARRNGRRALVVGLVAWASRSAPQLILVEDLHWADAPTLQSLAAIMAAASENPVALMATTRPEGDPLEGAWRSVSLDHPVSIISLGPLRAGEAREMATGFARASEGRLAECLERAAGNPLFLEQLLQNVAESAEALVPGSIQSLVLARMDRLAPGDRRALQAASVLGQRFGLGALRQVADDPGYDCAGLVRHQLVRPDGEDFLFTHALIRDGVYGSILTAARQRLHLRAAGYFAGTDAVLWAEHLQMAGDAGAARAYLEAARAELAKFRLDQGLALLEKGRMAAKSPEDRVALSLELGEARLHSGAVGEAREAFSEALEMAPGEADRCQALLGLSAVKRVTDDVEGALLDVAAALDLAERLDLPAEAARAYYIRGNLSFPGGDIDGCLRAHGMALELARKAGSAELEAAALGGLADAEYLAGRFRSACARFTECVEISRAHGFGRIEVANLPMIGFTANWSGDCDIALKVADEAVAAASKVGNPRAMIVAHEIASLCCQMQGHLAAARRHSEDSLEISRQLGTRRFEAEDLFNVAYIDHLEGHCAEAARKARTAVAIAREGNFKFLGPAALALVLLTTDDPDEGKRAIAEAEEVLAAGAVTHNHPFVRGFGIEWGLREGDFAAAERHAQALLDFLPEEGLGLLEFIAQRGFALARAGRGERSPELAAEIDRLIGEAERMKQVIHLAALHQAREALAEAASPPV
ncbi:MAG TPA: adenylate/guanylate cyclase domain-containing protein [Thermohalobaculum sp.]|nr:adenylate/guanylate cyclase domain-containing protein [Thermohalobaculum sp.]